MPVASSWVDCLETPLKLDVSWLLLKCDGALYCIQTSWLWRDSGRSSNQGRRTNSSISQYMAAVIFIPSRTWIGPISHCLLSSPISWHLLLLAAFASRWWLWSYSSTHHLAHPSGPLRVARVSLLIITYCISSFIYVLGQSTSRLLCLEGFVAGGLLRDMLFDNWLLVAMGISGHPASF